MNERVRSHHQLRTPRSLLIRTILPFTLLLGACSAESTHSPDLGLGVAGIQAAENASADATTGAQAFAGDADTKVATATAALAAGASVPNAAAASAPSVPDVVAATSVSTPPDAAPAAKRGLDLFRSQNLRARSRPALAKRRSPLATRASTRRPARPVGPKKRRVTLAALPGVRANGVMSSVQTLGREATKRVGKLSEPVRVASAAALARIGRNGLRTQHSKVSVACLKPRLVAMIKKAERHFGRHAVVTSGYRSPRHNRRVGGARRSMHVSCQAADIQIAGVTKWKLASWLRQQEDRGGVGTYCHTRSVHIDTGKPRDWNWRCKRRRRRS